MPIHEYRCDDCSHEFELLLLPRETDKPECPACHGTNLERLLSGFAVSTKELQRARVETAKARRLSSKLFKDRQVAEAEEVREHLAEEREVLPAKKT